MNSGLSRRRMMQAMGVAALSPVGVAAARVSWPPAEGSNSPKICLGTGPDTDEAGMRRLKQIGVDHVLMGGPGFLGRRPTSAAGWSDSRPLV